MLKRKIGRWSGRMFTHIYIYRLKCILRDRETVFWTLVFPLILAVFFNMAFSNLNKSTETFKAINIAVIDDEQYQADHNFKTVLNEVSQGENRLFNLTVATSRDEADKLLDESLIDGYIVVETRLKLVVKESGISQSIIKSFLDNYVQTASAVKSILSGVVLPAGLPDKLLEPGKLPGKSPDTDELPDKSPGTLAGSLAGDEGDVSFASPGNPANYTNPGGSASWQKLLDSLRDRRVYVRDVPGTRAEPDNMLNYFYTLIAMACFYGSFFGMREIMDIQADLSTLAARINTAPVHKLKAFIYSMSASLTVHVAEMLILIAFLRFIIGVDFGPKTGLVILTTIVGSIAGTTFGAFISAAVKVSENFKVGILIGASMIGSFLAGMMYQNMKYIVSQKAPLLSFLNPINLLTDAFYCLYYYDSYSRYAVNICILLFFIIAFLWGIYLMIRRRKYASI